MFDKISAWAIKSRIQSNWYYDREIAWHHLAIDQVFTKLNTTALGLEYLSARRKLRKHRHSKIKLNIFIASEFSLVAILIWFSDRSVVAIIFILAIALLIKIIDRVIAKIIAQRISKLSSITSSNSQFTPSQFSDSQSSLITVLRDGKWWQVAKRDLVIGDVVKLNSGDRSEVDLRLFAVSEDLQVNQTVIGGTVRTSKQIEPVDALVAKLDRTNMIYAGCKVNLGEVLGVVVRENVTTSVLQIETQQWIRIAQILIILIFITSLILAKGLMAAIATCLILYPHHWLQQAKLSQLIALDTLQKFGILVQGEIGVIDQLAQISLFCLMLDRPFNYAQPDSVGLSIHGILRGTTAEAEAFSQEAHIPIYSNQESPLERIRLWQLQSQTVAVVAQQKEDICLFNQADLAICGGTNIENNYEADRTTEVGLSELGLNKPGLLEKSDLILPSSDFDLIAITILAARGMWHRMHQVIELYAVSVIPILAFSFLVNPSIWQLLWLGTIVIPLLNWAVWAESPSLNLMALPVSYFNRLIPVNHYFNLGLGTVAIALPSLVLFYTRYGNNIDNLISARTMALVSLIVGLTLYTAANTRSALRKNHLLIAAISIILISLFGLIKFDPTLTVLSGWQWLTAILIGSSALWVQQFSRAIK